MKVKTQELIGPALDWAVAKCEDESIRLADGRVRFALSQFTNDYDLYSPSDDWAQGGPIIELNEIGSFHYIHGFHGSTWSASIGSCGFQQDGPTPLIAAMRCYVASKLGDVVDIPDELA